jgi:hypothetical protein
VGYKLLKKIAYDIPRLIVIDDRTFGACSPGSGNYAHGGCKDGNGAMGPGNNDGCVNGIGAIGTKDKCKNGLGVTK